MSNLAGEPENRPLVQNVAGLTLGIYLIHPMVIEILKDCGVFRIGDIAVLSVLLYVAIVTVLSAALVFLFGKRGDDGEHRIDSG